jgi:hypothetical protein
VRLNVTFSLTTFSQLIKGVNTHLIASVFLLKLINDTLFVLCELVSSCMSKLSQINRVSKCFDKETISLLVSALVINKLLYCSSAWSNTSAKNINKLQLVQNFACRIVTNSKKFEHISPKLQELNWLPVKEHLLFRDAVLMYKCINNLDPPYLCNKFSKRSNLHECNTRNRELLQIPI